VKSWGVVSESAMYQLGIEIKDRVSLVYAVHKSVLLREGIAAGMGSANLKFSPVPQALIARTSLTPIVEKKRAGGRKRGFEEWVHYYFFFSGKPIATPAK